MKLVSIVATERDKGNSVQASHYIAGKLDAELEIVDLTELDIKPCKACYSCLFESECIIDDDVEVVYDKVKEGDFILISSPTYLLDATGSVKAFLDRQLLAFTRMDGFEEKNAAIVTVHGLEGMKGWASSTHLVTAKVLGLDVVANAEIKAALPGRVLSKVENRKKLDQVTEALRKGERTIFENQCPVCTNNTFWIGEEIECTVCGSKLDKNYNVLNKGKRLTKEYFSKEEEWLKNMVKEFDHKKSEIAEEIRKIEEEIGTEIPKYE